MPAYKYKTKKGTLWFFSVPYFNYETNKRDRKVGRGYPGRKEALEAERQFLNHNQRYQNGDLTLREIHDHRMKTVSQSSHTKINYESRFKKHIETFFKEKKIHEISLDELTQFRTYLLNNMKSQNSAKSVFNLLELLYDHANIYFKQDNLIKRVPTIKKVKAKNGYIPLEEFYQRVDNMKDDVYKRIVIFQVNTALRVGESLALKWRDIDFNNRTLTINKIITSDNKLEYRVKTDESEGIFPYSDIVHELLITMYEQAKQEHKHFTDDYFIFGGIKHHYSDQVYSRFKKVFPEITVHDLRHSFATHLAKQKVDIRIVKELMRHSSISTTINQYTHVYDEDRREALSSFNMYQK